MPGQPRVLVVDDEADVREGLVEYLRRHGLDASGAAGGDEARRSLAARPADLLVLDLAMPGEDGLSLLRWLRARSAVAVIIVTATAEPFDRTIGLELGADDYVGKPCDPRELLARIRSVLRRAVPPRAGEGDPPGQPVLRIGGCVVDLRAGLVLRGDGEARLTAMELRLLRVLARHSGEVLDRDRLTRLAYGRERDPRDRSIDSRVMRIRRLIEADAKRPKALTSIRGGGYRLEPVD
ncbi:MAG TPA: response regulator transcription factor [Geminicoccaceae bacterium]|nr:response regulator transcription factor [Geminicoccus sp.]HMU51562.1 response regulator transcription factor [Geminicoccaceae bacterium]